MKKKVHQHKYEKQGWEHVNTGRDDVDVYYQNGYYYVEPTKKGNKTRLKKEYQEYGDSAIKAFKDKYDALKEENDKLAEHIENNKRIIKEYENRLKIAKRVQSNYKGAQSGKYRIPTRIDDSNTQKVRNTIALQQTLNTWKKNHDSLLKQYKDNSAKMRQLKSAAEQAKNQAMKDYDRVK